MTEVAALPASLKNMEEHILGANFQEELRPGETILTAKPEREIKKVKKVKKQRPARCQVDAAIFRTDPPPQTGAIFNIWYNKWSGGDRDNTTQTPAKGRCDITRDTGYTQADRTPGSFFCLFFARGLCPKGKDCQYLHRLPTSTDIFSPHIDCFGREKFSSYRDDLGGVGSFMHQNRTIYIGHIHDTPDVEEVIARHFSPWGPVERIRVLNNRGVAFVTYATEAIAEFAKEAMAHQSLDHDEILNIRWATPDPNPLAQAREARRIEEQAAAAIRASLPLDYVVEIEGDRETQKRRKIEGSFGLQGYEAPDDVWFSRNQGVEEGGSDPDPVSSTALEENSANKRKESGDSTFLPDSLILALNKTGGSFRPVKKVKPSGPLIDYDSDDEN
ncbi:hypothetical protein B7463_g10807, partial [Scytalidium lignicola]